MTDALIGIGIAVILGWLGIKWARRAERKDLEHDDMEHAEDIRRRLDRVDERLRDFDDSGWRD